MYLLTDALVGRVKRLLSRLTQIYRWQKTAECTTVNGFRVFVCHNYSMNGEHERDRVNELYCTYFSCDEKMREKNKIKIVRQQQQLIQFQMENNEMKINFRGSGTTAVRALFTFSPFIFTWMCSVGSTLNGTIFHFKLILFGATGTHCCRYYCSVTICLVLTVCSPCGCVGSRVYVWAAFSNAFRVYKTECELAIVIRITHCTSLHLTACYMHYRTTVNKLFPVRINGISATLLVYRYLHTLHDHHRIWGEKGASPSLSALCRTKYFVRWI